MWRLQIQGDEAKYLYILSFQITVLLELRYRSPLEGNEDSDDDALIDDEDDEEFVPGVGLVSVIMNHTGQCSGS